jgi:hypothetical protein
LATALIARMRNAKTEAIKCQLVLLLNMAVFGVGEESEKRMW